MSEISQKAREAYDEAMHTKAAFQEIRTDAHAELTKPNMTQKRAFELAVTLRVIDAVQNKLIGIVQDAEYEAKVISIQGEQG